MREQKLLDSPYHDIVAMMATKRFWALLIGLAFVLVLLFSPNTHKSTLGATASITTGSNLLAVTQCVTEFSINAESNTVTYTGLDLQTRTVPMARVIEINESGC